MTLNETHETQTKSSPNGLVKDTAGRLHITHRLLLLNGVQLKALPEAHRLVAGYRGDGGAVRAQSQVEHPVLVACEEPHTELRRHAAEFTETSCTYYQNVKTFLHAVTHRRARPLW